MRTMFITLVLLTSFVISYGKPLVVCSIKPICDIAKSIGKEKIETHYVIPPNVSVHLYEYRINDIKMIYKSDLFLYLGVGEPNLDKVVRSKSKGVYKRIIDIDGIHIIHEFEFEKHSHEKETPHPAVWLDPKNGKIIGDFIYQYLSQVDQKNMYFYQKNLEEFSKSVEEVIKYGKKKFSQLKNKYFISYHYVWPYFTKRFGLVYLDVIELGHGREPTAKHLMEIIKEINRYKIKSIFASVQFYNKKYIELIKRSTNVRVVLLDPFGKDMGYLQMIKDNIDKIYEGLR